MHTMEQMVANLSLSLFFCFKVRAERTVFAAPPPPYSIDIGKLVRHDGGGKVTPPKLAAKQKIISEKTIMTGLNF